MISACIPPPVSDGNENDEGAPPRSRKKLVDPPPPLFMLTPREWLVACASLALRMRNASWAVLLGDIGIVVVVGVGSLMGSGVSVGDIRTHTIHQPRLVLHVRSISRGRARVSRYVLNNWWWILMDSRRDQGLLFGCDTVYAARSGMLGMEERIVRFEGS